MKSMESWFFSVSQKKGTIARNLFIPQTHSTLSLSWFPTGNWFCWLTQLLGNLRHTGPRKSCLILQKLHRDLMNWHSFLHKITFLAKIYPPPFLGTSPPSLTTPQKMLIVFSAYSFLITFSGWGGQMFGLLAKRELCDSGSVNRTTKAAFQVDFKLELLLAAKQCINTSKRWK